MKAGSDESPLGFISALNVETYKVEQFLFLPYYYIINYYCIYHYLSLICRRKSA